MSKFKVGWKKRISVTNKHTTNGHLEASIENITHNHLRNNSPHSIFVFAFKAPFWSKNEVKFKISKIKKNLTFQKNMLPNLSTWSSVNLFYLRFLNLHIRTIIFKKYFLQTHFYSKLYKYRVPEWTNNKISHCALDSVIFVTLMKILLPKLPTEYHQLKV